MGFAETLGVTVLAAVVFGFLAWLMRPLLNRLEPMRMKITRDHGIRIDVACQPGDLEGVPRAQILDLDPAWIADDDFFFPGGIPGPGPTAPRDWIGWAMRHGGEPVGWRHVLVRIQSSQDRAVLVLHPKVVVKTSDTDPAVGVVLGPEREPGGNGLVCRGFHVDLDSSEPAAHYYPGMGQPDNQSSLFPLAKGSTEAFLFIAKAQRGRRYEWSLVIEFRIDGKRISLRALDRGRPFITVGPEGLARRWWHFRTGSWSEASVDWDQFGGDPTTGVGST